MNTSVGHNLLTAIANKAAVGDLVAVVRILSRGESAIFCVNDEQLYPPIDDLMIADSAIRAVRSLLDKGVSADLIELFDEQGSDVKLAVELVRPKAELLVFGAGHVGQAVAQIGVITGYNVTVVDDREEFASRTRLPDTRINLLVSDYATATEKLKISACTAVVIVTRGHQYDELCLKNVIRSSAMYIGMIGSRRRVMSVFKKLASEGASQTELQKVHAPIGLRISARSPQEIAVSILAEIIDHVNNGREKQGERNVI